MIVFIVPLSLYFAGVCFHFKQKAFSNIGILTLLNVSTSKTHKVSSAFFIHHGLRMAAYIVRSRPCYKDLMNRCKTRFLIPWRIARDCLNMHK